MSLHLDNGVGEAMNLLHRDFSIAERRQNHATTGSSQVDSSKMMSSHRKVVLSFLGWLRKQMRSINCNKFTKNIFVFSILHQPKLEI